MIKKTAKKFTIFLALAILVAAPVFAAAQTIDQTCNGPQFIEGLGFKDCGFNDLVRLAKTVMDFLILLSLPLSAIAFAWAGALMLSAGGSESQVEKAKEIFKKVLIGFIIVLSAWLIVRFVTSAILCDGEISNEDCGYIDLLGGVTPP